MLTLNQIHHGDCLELMQDIPSGSIDMILCDLPYGTTACKWDTIIPFDELWAQYERVIKPNGAIVLTATFPFSGALWASNPPLFRYSLVWEKTRSTGFQNAGRMPMKRHEDVLIFYKKLPVFNQLMLTTLIKPIDNRRKSKAGEVLGRTGANGVIQTQTGFADSILKFANNSNTAQHPTQKPVALFEYLIRTYTNPGDVVLDNCAGSFTTAVAAENTGRNWICIEQEAKYCEIGRARLAALQPQLALC